MHASREKVAVRAQGKQAEGKAQKFGKQQRGWRAAWDGGAIEVVFEAVAVAFLRNCGRVAKMDLPVQAPR